MRECFLVERTFSGTEMRLEYKHHDRIAIGGTAPGVPP